MGSGRARKTAVIAVAALLVVVVSAVLVASAAPTPRTMKYACASQLYGVDAVLHYVNRPSQCKGSGESLITFKSDYPVYTCRKEHGTPRGVRSPVKGKGFGIHTRGPAGLMRHVSKRSDCKPATQPNETPHTLPGKTRQYFCVAKKSAELRWVAKAKECTRREFASMLPKRKGKTGVSTGGAPVANPDSAGTDEASATNINVLANDRTTATSSSNGGLSVDSIDTLGTHGTATLNPDGTIAYNPNGQFEALKVGETATDTFQYRVKKGALTSTSTTVTVTVTGVNDAPVANADTTSGDEDHAKTISVLGNDTDTDGDALTVGSVDTAGTKGHVTINGGGTVTYDPDAKFESLAPGDTATDSFKYRANDGHADSAPATVTATIAGVNDAPVLSGVETSSLGYVDGSAAAAVSPGVHVADVDNANVHGAVVKIATGYSNGTDTLQFTPAAPISGTFDAATGTLTLAGTDTKAHYESALRSIQFHSSGSPSGDRGISFQVDDGSAQSKDSNTVTRTVSVDRAPTDIGLSPANVDENKAVGTTVGTLSSTDPDGGDPHSYSFVTGAGDGSNGAFAIDGDTLKTAQSFDFESTATRSVRVQTDDSHGGTFVKQLTITINNANDAPSDIALSNATVAENLPAGTNVGDLSTTDQDGADTHTYALDSVGGGADNGSFKVTGNHLETNGPLDFEAQSSYAVRVRSTDNGSPNEHTVRDFTITATNANDQPTDISLSSTTVTENSSAPTTVGTFSSADQDTADGHTYSLVAGDGTNDADNGSFQIGAGGTLEAKQSFDFETKSTYKVHVRTTDDGSPAKSFEKAFTITVGNANDAPTNIALSNANVEENKTAPEAVGDFTTTDQDSAQTHSYSLVAGDGTNDADNGSFTITAGGTLQAAQSFDFETKSTYKINVRTTDNGSPAAHFDKAFTITVNDANDAPTNIALSNASVEENKAAPEPVGDFTTTDQDSGQTHSYSLVAGDGTNDADNGSFDITPGGTLRATAPLDREAKQSLKILVRSTDNGSPVKTFTKAFTITVTDANDAPTDIALSSASITENTPAPGTVGTLSSTDQDTGDGHTYSLVAGDGVNDADNGSFDITPGGVLQANQSFDFETKSAYKVNIRSTDDGSPAKHFDKAFTITVINANDAPTDIQLSTSSQVEHQAVHTAIGDFTTTDQDSADTHDYTLVAGGGGVDADNGSFDITPAGTLRNATDLASGTYKINVRSTDSGSPAKSFDKAFTISVKPPNLDPTDISLSNQSVDENKANELVGTLSTTDGDAGDDHTYTLVPGDGTNDADNAKFTVGGGAGHDELRTAGALDFEADSTLQINIRTDDGHGGTFDKAFTITVGDLNDAPTNIALSDANVEENKTAPEPVGDFTTTDQDSGQTHSYSLVAGDGTNDADNGSFAITPGGTLEATQSFDFETKATYRINVRTTDNGSPAKSFDKAFTIAVTDANDAPTDIALSNANVEENKSSGESVGNFTTTDPDSGQSHSYSLVGGADDSSFSITPGGTLQTTQSFDFETKASYSITVRTTDNGSPAKSFDKPFTITVINANDAPTDIALSSTSINENSGANATVGTLSSQDQDAGQTHSYALVAGSAGVDADNASFFITAGGVLKTVGDFDFETKSSYKVNIQSTDNGSPAKSFTKAFTITVLDVNDAPTDLALSNASVDENVASGTTIGNLTTTDQDSGQTFTYTLPSGQLDNSKYTVTAAGVLKTSAALNFEADPSDTVRVRTTDNGSPAKFYEEDFVITINDVNDAPVAANDTVNGAINNTTLVGDDPADPAPTPSGPRRTVTASVLSNDTDQDTGTTLSVTGAGTNGSNGQTTDGGTVTIQTDGDFVVTRAPSANCSDVQDSFLYTLSDGNNSKPPGSAATTTGSVTVNYTADCVWYVKNNAPVGPGNDDGASDSPFRTLAQAETASGADDYTFVFDGDNTSTGYTTGYTMSANEHLIGEQAGLTVGGVNLVAANPGALPTLTATNEDVVDLTTNNEVRAFNIDPSGTGSGIAGSAGDTGGGTIDDVHIVDTLTAGSQPGLELDSTTGTYNFTNFSVDNSAAVAPPSTATGVRLNNASADFGSSTIRTAGAKGIDAVGTTNMNTSTFGSVIVTDSGVGGVNMNGTTGTTNLGDGSGNDLLLTTTSGATAALRLNNAGTVVVDTAGTDDVLATGGPAVDVTSMTSATLDIDHLESQNSSTDGVNLDGAGVTFSTGSGSSISAYTGIGFDLDGGSGAIDYAGTFGNASSASSKIAEITGRTNGAVTFSGAINHTNGTGAGIDIGSSNTGGSTNFTSTTKDISTGTSDAVKFDQVNGDAHTVTFSNGGLNIDTTDGKGIQATGASTDGTLNVTGTGNTIDTGNGKSLRVQDVNVGAAPLRFQHISGNGTNAGILLSNTGANSALTVEGIGGTCTVANTGGCTGGTISNTTGSDDAGNTPAGTGIVLNNTKGISLEHMYLHDNSNYAIRGHSVSGGFTLANTVVNGVNGNNINGPYLESSVSFADLTGSALLSNDDISGGAQNGVIVTNAGSGDLNRITFDNTTVAATQAGGGDAVQLESLLGAGNLKATIQNDSDFTAAAGDLLDFQHNGSGTGDLVVSSSDFQNTIPIAQQAGGGGGVTVRAGSDMTTSFNDDDFSGAKGVGVLLLRTSQATPHTLTGSFTNNRIGVAGVTSSGSAQGSALKMQNSGGGGTMTMTVTGNVINQYDEVGIEFWAGTGVLTNTGTSNLTITGNTVQNPGPANDKSKFGLHLNVATGGNGSNDNQTVCADVKGNNLASSGRDSTPSSGLGDLDFNVRSRGQSTLRLPGLTGSLTDMTNVQNFVSANNQVGGSPVGLARRDAAASYSGAGTTCPQ